jgi:two-component system cell cycle response regulator
MKPGSTILIVDDDPGARDTLEALLILEGYQLALACNGTEALAKAAQLTPSLILLDVMMPDMDGFEVCRRLRAIPLLAEVPIIMVTALDDHDSRLQGLEAGADDFISKPYNRSELRARVRTVIRLDRYRRLLLERMKVEWVVQHAEDGYLIINETDQIVYANARARLYLGLPASSVEQGMEGKSEPIAESFLTLARKQYRLEPQEAWMIWPEHPADAPSMPRYLVRPETTTAQVFWLQVESLALPSELDLERIVRLADMTTQVISQRSKRGFHTMIYHKLRTPLAGILGSLDFVIQHASKLSGKEVKEFSEIAFKSAQRLHSEIEDILQYLNTHSVYKSGESFVLSHLPSLVTQIRTNLGIETVTVSVQEELTDACTVLSRQAFGLVLWEILENAKKFHPSQQPAVDITVSQASADIVSFKIRDNGLSLSPDQLSKMWMPYYQGEKYVTGELQGMGLGLATVASVIWGAGGTYHVYNREDGPGIVVELNVPLFR